MKKINVDNLNKYLTALQNIAVILGVVFVACSLFEIMQQTRLQTKALQQTKEIQSADFVLQMEKELGELKYDNITKVIQDGRENKLIIGTYYKNNEEPISEFDVQDYIGNFDNIGLLVESDLILPEMAYENFSYIIEKAWCNKDVQNMIKRDRNSDNSKTAISNPYYVHFENLAKNYIAKDRIDCKTLK